MFNSATLLGRIGKKETKTLSNGSQLTVLSIATHRNFRTPEGEKKEKTTWHRVSCFAKVQEIAEAYTQVGDLVLIRGEIQHQQVQNGEDKGQFMYSVTAEKIQLIPKGSKTEAPQTSKEAETSQKKTNEYAFLDDDVMF